jgi:ribosomal protein S1
MESFAALFEESLQRQEMRAGEVITAEIVRIDQNFVVVNAGLKSESMIPVEEFHNERGELEAKPGDFVLVAIEMLEDGYGATRLSREKAKRIAAWNDLDKAMVDGALVSGLVTGKVKGGLTVMVNGIRAFLPGSLVDTRPVKDTTPFEGKELEFKVIKLDRKRNNVVVSRRAVLEASMGEERQKLLENLQEGTVIKGIVKNITDYGAFVDLGGIDGLLHITDLAWRRVRHPQRSAQRRRRSHRQGAQVRPGKEPRQPRHEAARRRSVGGNRPPLPAGHAPVRQGHQPDRLRLRSSRSSRASKAWCTSRKWTGPTRTSTRPRWSRSATRSKS